jgi:SHS2 domain-containing protein
MPYEILPHTADWALHVEAGELSELFAEAARGMNFLSGIHLADGERLRRGFEAHAEDKETLLVSFLSELVYAIEQEGLGFDEFTVDLQPPWLRVDMTGAAIAAIDKAIKAVTYHNLAIRQTDGGYEVDIVFDV